MLEDCNLLHAALYPAVSVRAAELVVRFAGSGLPPAVHHGHSRTAARRGLPRGTPRVDRSAAPSDAALGRRRRADEGWRRPHLEAGLRRAMRRAQSPLPRASGRAAAGCAGPRVRGVLRGRASPCDCAMRPPYAATTNTRRRIATALDNLENKELSSPYKKHDNIPL